MSNSSLVSYTKISPYKNSPRNHKVDRITPHCYVGQVTVQDAGNFFQRSNNSCNYIVDKNGKVGLIVDEKDRSWCSSSPANDHRAITIENACDKKAPYAFSNATYNGLIELCVDICKRYGKTELLWIPDKTTALSYEPKDNEMLLTVHRWFAATACPGDWMFSRMGELAKVVTARLATIDTTCTEITNENHNMTKNEFIEYVGKIAVEDWKNRRICLPSVVVAQAIKESGAGTTELAKNANALFGIKRNGWTGDIYVKAATEQNPDGSYRVVDNTEWRKYKSWKESILDHNDYLATRKIGNQSEPNFKAVIGETDYRKAVAALQSAQYKYATSLTYAESLIRDYIVKYNLTRFDDVKTKKVLYRVQAGAYASKANAEKQIEKVKAAGYKDAYMFKQGLHYKVQAGSYGSKSNAQNTVAKLATKNIKSIIVEVEVG